MGHETGADDYIVKPFDPRNLLSIVKGKILRSVNTQDKTGLIAVEGLSPGMYNLEFLAGDQVRVQKLLVGD